MTSNMPKGDKWELIDNDIDSLNYGKKFKFDFSYVTSADFKNILKHYVWRNYVENNKVLGKTYRDIVRFKHFSDFSESNKIYSLKYLTNNHISTFVSYLKTSLKDNKKPLSYAYQKICLDTLKAIIRWGQLYMPDEVPKVEIFAGNEYLGVNRKLKIDFIPDDIVRKINIALKVEENPYVRYGIVILQSTGMRIGDMLKLKIDCLKPHPISGMTLAWYDYKNRKERQPMPVTNECAMAITKLIEITEELRHQADNDIKEYIFIHMPSVGRGIGEALNISQKSFGNWLKDFVKRNDIRDTNGELINLTAHKFRRTLATDMLSKGTDLNAIQDVLGHSDPSVTKMYYADVKDKERAETLRNIGIIGNVNFVDESIVPDNNELAWFKQNKDKGARMCDGYCTKPFKDGEICDRLLKRKKCYTCRRYITTPEYLETHRSYLKELEQQIENNIYGEHYAEHFIPTIEVLKEIIRRLEELQYASTETSTASDK